MARLLPEGTCSICGCTDNDCTECIERTGKPCSWITPILCSACLNIPAREKFALIARSREKLQTQHDVKSDIRVKMLLWFVLGALAAVIFYNLVS